MSLTVDERETTINLCDGDDLVRIYSCQRQQITRMRNHAAFTEVESGIFDGTEFARFTIPADCWSPLGVKRTRAALTEEQHTAAVERLALARAARSGTLITGQSSEAVEPAPVSQDTLTVPTAEIGSPDQASDHAGAVA